MSLRDQIAAGLAASYRLRDVGDPTASPILRPTTFTASPSLHVEVIGAAYAAPLVEALKLIAGDRCENYTSGSCIGDRGRTKDAPYTAERWCDACIAADALGGWK